MKQEEFKPKMKVFSSYESILFLSGSYHLPFIKWCWGRKGTRGSEQQGLNSTLETFSLLKSTLWCPALASIWCKVMEDRDGKVTSLLSVMSQRLHVTLQDFVLRICPGSCAGVSHLPVTETAQQNRDGNCSCTVLCEVQQCTWGKSQKILP